MRIAIVLVAVALSACGRTAPVAPGVLRALSPGLAAPCADPVAVPAGDLGADVVGALWARDRVELRDCSRRHWMTVDHFARRDEAIRGE
jgi:hypothetical protein